MEPEASESPEQAPDVLLRPGEPGDMDFVASSWRRNYDAAYQSIVCPGGIGEYIATQSQVIDVCLRTSEVVVAHPPGRREQILGWCCYREPSVVHYVFVKPYYRRAGIGRWLLRAALGRPPVGPVVFTTHRWNFKHAEGIGAICTRVQRDGVRIEYNPALIFGRKT